MLLSRFHLLATGATWGRAQRLVLGVAAAVACALPLHAQRATGARQPAARAEAVAQFADGEPILRESFERIYRKNLTAAQSPSNADARAYLELYIAFRRKVKQAQALGLDTTQAFRDELAGYLRQLAASYLTDRARLDQLVDEAVARDQQEVSARHILLTCAPTAAPADTLRIRQRLLVLRDSALSGVPFDQLARRHSHDPSARRSGGDLGAFSVLDMVYPFEQAAYTTPVGAISGPVRSRYGYHLIQVNARGPKAPVRPAAHLFVAVRGADPAAEAAGRRRIDSLYLAARAGASFAELCACCSDDATTARKAGDLGTQRLLPELDGPKRALEPGQLSEPLRSPYGWHLLRVGDALPPPAQAERRRELRQRVGRDERARLAQQAFVQRLLADYRYTADTAALGALARHLAPRALSLRPGLADSLPPTLAQRPLARFADQRVGAAQLLRYKLEQGDARLAPDGPTTGQQAAPAAAVLHQLEADLGRYVQQRVLEYEERQLPQRNAEFRALADEYRDGLLMFSLMDQRVWRRALEDSAGLRQFYLAHPDSFRSGPRLAVARLTGPDSAQLAQRARAIHAAPSAPLPDSLRGVEWSPEPELIEALRAGQRPPPHLRRTAGGWQAVVHLAELPPALLPLAEARPELVRRYQAQLEAQLAAELERRYPLTRNEAVLSRVAR